MATIKQRIKKHLPDWVVLIRNHWKAHGDFPRLFRPATFNDKVLRRLLIDHRPLWSRLADKSIVRDFIEERLGPGMLPKLYHLTADPKTIPFDDLPQKFVVKPTHGTAWVRIVHDKSKQDRDELIAQCHDWLSQSLYRRTREWPYKNIKPQIMVEEFIDNGTGLVPPDYKLFTFDGLVRMIQVDIGRFTGHRRRLLSPAWQRFDVQYAHNDVEGDMPPPKFLKEMIRAAETIGRDLDFIRVDFMETSEKYYIGEITSPPGCGHERFEPKSFDYELGSYWKQRYN